MKTTVKTSEVLRDLNLELLVIRTVHEQVRMDLEDDARIEDLQLQYRKLVEDKFALFASRYSRSKLRSPFAVVRKYEEILNALDALYRLVK